MDTNQIEQFFTEYGKTFSKALQDPPIVDVDSVVNSFADFCVAANPAGINGSRNDEQFRSMIPKGFEFYKNIGTTSVEIASLDISELDDYHAMVKVHWDSRYARPDGKKGRIEFDIIYFVQMIGGNPKIFAFITGDEQKVLQEHGLAPG